MENKKKLTILIVLYLSLQSLIGLDNLFFNDREEYKIKKIQPELSDILVGNYTVPGVSVPISPNRLVKIGMLHDLDHFIGDHAWNGALLAAREINEGGGIDIYANGTDYYIGLAAEDTDENDQNLSPPKGVDAANRMITYNNPHFITGGYRAEALLAYQEVIMEAEIPFLSTGVAPDIFCTNVINDYNTYKYFFRVMPTNSTSIGSDILEYLTSLILHLNSTYDGLCENVTVLQEDLTWAEPLSLAISSYLPSLTYGLVNTPVVYPISISVTYSEMVDIWNQINTSRAQVVIPIFSSKAAINVSKAYAAVQPKSLMVGVNVMSQTDDFWDDTEGTCHYEIEYQSTYNVSKTSKTIPFWNHYVEEYNMEPLYTAVGSYTAVYMLANATVTAQSLNSNDIVTTLEGFDRNDPFIGAGGKVAFWSNSHDLVAGPDYAYGLWCQWQLDGKKAVVTSYNLQYPDSITTGKLSLPYWGIHNLTEAQDLPGDFILNSTADDPDVDGTFSLNWTDSAGADNYSIFIYDKPITYVSKNLNKLAQQDVLEKSPVLVSDLKTGVYYCIVVAYNKTGEKFSNYVEVTVERPKPGDFTLTSDADIPVDTDGAFYLTWTASEGADNYSIYSYNNFITQINESLTIEANQTAVSPFPITGLTDGDYFYVVVAYNGTGEKLSNNINVKIRFPPGPFSLSSDADLPDTDGTFNLSWTDSARTVNYSIYQYSGYISEINGSLTLLNTVQANINTIGFANLSIGFYYFIVAAYNGFNFTLSNCIRVDVQYYDDINRYWQIHPFIIDDTGAGDYRWSQVATLPWCTGSGTPEDPYVIESIKVDGNDDGSCIIVRESNVSFIIKESSFYNAGNNDESNPAGIQLINVIYGALISLNCSNNNANGISIEYCQNISIISSSINNNLFNGIILFNSNNISITNNADTISSNEINGIYLMASSYNRIIRNTINYNEDNGILLNENSNHNFIFENTLRGNGRAIYDLGNDNVKKKNLPIRPEFPTDMLIILITISVIVFVGVAGAIILRKKISQRRVGLKKEKEVSEKKREKIRHELEEKLDYVDYLIKENSIKLAYKNLGKIKDKADQYDFFDIYNEATKKVDFCKEVEAGIQRTYIPSESLAAPVVEKEAREKIRTVPITEKIETSKRNIFISYSTLDSEHFQISRIVQRLKEYPDIGKIRYWERDSKENIVEFMDRTLKESNVFILFCSEHSIKSAAVKDEWQAAFQRRKKGLIKMIPVYEKEEHVPPLLGHLLNVKYTIDDFNGFIDNLHREILR